MKKNVHIIPHMHWDREWYFSDCESSILLLNNMEEIIYMLENNENYPCFLLDGQTAILEDYLSFKPQNKERIKDLVQKEKLIIGPWYTQTDEMVVGGESIVRNLLYGFKDCKQFGNVMKISYLPDSFGQSARIPQILAGFGIKHSVFWRGVSERMGTDKTEFYWEDDTNDKVLVQLLPLGYAIGKYLPTDKELLKKRMDGYFKVLDKGATTENIIIPNGHDQMPIQKNIFEIIDILKEIEPNRNYFLSRYENVFKELEKEMSLKTLKGEFLDAKYSRVHRSIYSARADIKSCNTRIENKITNILEPLASIAYSLGFVYEAGYIESIWKSIMKNHAHDSMGCCCHDKVHKAIKNRFFEAEEKTDSLITFYKRKIVDAIDDTVTLDKFVAFNLLPYDRNCAIEGDIITKMKGFSIFDSDLNKIKFDIIKTEEVDAGIIDRQIVHYGNYDYFTKYKINFIDTIPSIGYKTYFIKEEVFEYNIYIPEKLKEMENEFYKIIISENGTLIITDKQKNITYENIMKVEDGSDDGDEYDYSPLCDDFVVYCENVKADIEVIKYMYKTTATIKYRLNVPKDLTSRANKKIDSYIDFVFNITLEQNSELIKINLEVDNFAKDHRVRILIPNIFSTQFSIADNQFGQIKRAAVDDAIKVWEQENWKERPDAIYPMLNYVKTDQEDGIAFLTNSIREYELVEDILAITIFRSVGVLGKGDLLRRPGRPSGINLETPDSQMLGKNYYEFAFTKNSDTLARTAKEYLTPITTYNKMPYNAMKLNAVEFNTPNNFSLFSEKNSTITLSALKKAEEKDGLIVRYFNGTQKNTSAQIVFDGKIQKTNLNEDLVGGIINDEEISIKYNEVQTYYISEK